MRFLASVYIACWLLACAFARADEPLPVETGTVNLPTASDVADVEIAPIDHSKLLPLQHFLAGSPLDQTFSSNELAIDQRRFDLKPLTQFTLKRSRAIDARVKNLTVLAAFSQIRIDPRVTQLTPLHALRGDAVAAVVPESRVPNVTEVDLPPLEPVPTEPTLFLRDIRTTWQSELLYDDNVNSGATGQNGSWLTLNDVNTAITFQRRNNTYLASYGLTDRQYQGENAATLDQKAYLNATQELAKRNTLKLSWYWSENHELRGSGLLEGVETTAVNDVAVTRNQYSLDHNLGDNESRMRIKSRLSRLEQSYEQFDQITTVGNYTSTTLSSEVAFKTGPNTRWYVDGSWNRIDYKDDSLSDIGLLETLDASSRSLQVGLERNIGRHSSLKANWGQYQRQFEADRDTTLTSVWRTEFAWNPRTYSRFSFSYGKQFLPSRGNGSFIEVTDAQLKWSHQWSNRLRSQWSYNRYNDDFKDSLRDDKRENMSLIMTYAYSENWRLAAGYRSQRKMSNIETFEFDRSVWFLRSVLRF